MCWYRINQHLRNSSKFIQCFNHSSDGIYYCDNFKESKSEVKIANTVKSTT